MSDLASGESKRDIIELQHVAKRDDACQPQPTGSGPVPTPDTPAAFKSFQVLHVSLTIILQRAITHSL